MGDAVVVDVEPSEDRLEHQAPILIADTPIKGARVAHKLQRSLNDLHADVEIGIDVLELGGEPGALRLDVVQSLTDLLLRTALRGQIEEVLLLDLEPSELDLDLIAVKVRCVMLVGDGFAH